MTAVASKVNKDENNNVNDQLVRCGPDIQKLGTTAFHHHPARDGVIASFVLWIGECTGLLGATLENITTGSPVITDPRATCDKQGAAAVLAAQELLLGEGRMTVTGLPRPDGCDWTVGLGSVVGKLLTTRPRAIFISFILLVTSLITNTEAKAKQIQKTEGYLEPVEISSQQVTRNS
jgi:hypothetical protein